MPNKSTFAHFADKWRKLVTNVRANMQSGELPDLEIYREPLAEALEEAEDLSARLRVRRGVKQQEQRDLDIVMRKGRFYAGKLGSALRAHYGFQSPRLLDYGLKPLPSKLRPASETEEPKPGDPPAPPVEAQAPETAKAPEAAEPSPTPEAKPAA